MEIKKSIKLRIGIGFEWMEIGTEKTTAIQGNETEEELSNKSNELFRNIMDESVSDAVKVFNKLGIVCDKGILHNAYSNLSSKDETNHVSINVPTEETRNVIQSTNALNSASNNQSSGNEEYQKIVEEVEELFEFTEFN